MRLAAVHLDLLEHLPLDCAGHGFYSDQDLRKSRRVRRLITELFADDFGKRPNHK